MWTNGYFVHNFDSINQKTQVLANHGGIGGLGISIRQTITSVFKPVDQRTTSMTSFILNSMTLPPPYCGGAGYNSKGAQNSLQIG
jgi:hypothetical protein